MWWCGVGFRPAADRGISNMVWPVWERRRGRGAGAGRRMTGSDRIRSGPLKVAESLGT